MGSLGERLKQERERQGISLDEIALSTKITTRMLRAIEDEHFEQLPGGIFNKGFIRAYVRHLGLDEDQAVSDYMALSNQAEPASLVVDHPSPLAELLEVEKRPEVERPHPASFVPWGKLAFALVTAAFGFALWGSFSRQPKKTAALEPVRTTATSTEPTPPPQAGANGQERAEPADASQTSLAPVVDTANNEALQASNVTPGSFQVLVEAREDSWVSITADGKEVMTDILAAAAQRAIEARQEVVIKAGNVGALEFTFNGRKIPHQGGYDQVKKLTFDANGLQTPVSKVPADTALAGRPQV